MKRAAFFLIALLLFASAAHGAVFFSDNFDSCTSNCTVTTAGPPNSAGWSAWYASQLTATIGGVQHYSGEITSPGRGGTGKSLKMWRASTAFGDYSDALNWIGSGPNHWFMRYYIKIPTGFSSSQDYKLWRFNTNSGVAGKNEIYMDYYGGTWAIYDGGPWQNLISSSQYNGLLHDGNWHCVEFEFGLATNTLRFWIDDILRYENTNRTWTATGNLSGMQHFNIGNTYDHTGKWQSGWLAMEVDDFVLSTTYVGPVSGGVNPAPLPTPLPTPLPKQPNPPTGIQLQ